MITIYVHGCQGCGANAKSIQKVARYAKNIGEEVVIKASKYIKEYATEHLNQLQRAGMNTDGYTSIVLESNGSVTKLKEWAK